jgi:ribosomal-protein-alanine acetyltransferase
VKLSIRAAVPTDLPVIMSLEKNAATAAHWSVEQYEALFRASGPSRIVLVIEAGSAAVPAAQGAGGTPAGQPAGCRRYGEQKLNEREEVEQKLDESNGIQGFLIAKAVGVEWEIENIVIADPARRRGLASRLLTHVLNVEGAKGAESIFLEVRESNLAARRLYEKWSFVESGRRKQYYHAPQEDAIVYRREFS